MANLFKTKPLDLIVSEARAEGEHHLRRSLGAFSLTALGVGAVIGAGIFVMAGLGAHYAGPGLMLSFVLCGFGCTFAALCYAEFAAMIPLAGSAYTYAYATLGEIFAWIIGWDLTLEYAMGASTVSSGWSNHFVEFLKIFGLKIPLWLSYDHWTGLDQAKSISARQIVAQSQPGLAIGSQGYLDAVTSLLAHPTTQLTHAAHGLLNAPHFFGGEFGFNLPAFLIALVITTILVIGIKESATFNTLIVIVKVSVVLFILALGARFVHPGNWGNDWHSFAPFGFAGISSAAAYIFFAFIGFDAVSTTAQECRNPQRDLPVGIIASLLICTVLYVSVAAVLTGMVPWQLVDVEAPLTHAFLDHNLGFASDIITCGALAGLTSVMLVMLIGQTRVLYAMAADGLLPSKFFAAVHPKFRTPWKNTILVGLLAAIVGAVTPIDKIGKMVNIGTLLAFVMVCASVTVLRFTAPNQPRPFRTPGIYFGGRLPIVPALGILVNGYLMYSLGTANWIRLIVWLIIGLCVYFTYSVKHSKVQKLVKAPAAD
jgi:basic amino acid/polyamine antiporter, APA family